MEKKLHNCAVAIQVLPQGLDRKELIIEVVDEVIAYLKETGLSVFVGPFETTIEGDFDCLMDVIKGAHEVAINAGAAGLMTYLKISYNPDGVWSTEEKVGKYHD